MKTDNQTTPPKSSSYYVATILTHDGDTKLAHGSANDMPEFEQWLRTQYKFETLVWHQALPYLEDKPRDTKLLEVVPYKSSEDLKKLSQVRSGAEEADLFARETLKRLRINPELIYVAAGPVLICQNHILHIKHSAFSHRRNIGTDWQTNTFVSFLVGQIIKSFPEKKVIEVIGGGLRKGHENNRFGYTARPHLNSFTDIRYFHTGQSDNETHLIQHHVFLLWQMLHEESKYAVDLGEPFYPHLYKFDKDVS